MSTPDLNLLLVFDAVMRERNMRRAAERLNRSQPAVSQAVARLRDLFGDQLFRRVPTGVEPTPRAEAAWADMREPLERLYDQLVPSMFDPRAARAHLRIGLADDVHLLAFPEIVSELTAASPHLTVTAVETDHRSVWVQVRSGLIDIGVSVAPPPPKGLAAEVLLNQRFVVLHRADMAPPLTLSAYLERQHIALGFSDGVPGYVDARLNELGQARAVIASTPRFATIADLVVRTGAVATLPEPVARFFTRSGGVALAACPFELADTPVRLAWHLRRQSDPLNRWARERLNAVLVRTLRL